jgi:hypothetical protein
MADYPKRSHFFADFYAEGTLRSHALSPMLMGKPNTLGEVAIAIESSRFNNGNEWFHSSGIETGLFVIQGIKHITDKSVMPGENHATIRMNDVVRAYGRFIHNPTAYTVEDVAHGMSFDDANNSVEYKAALLTIPEYDHHEPILPVTIHKINALPRE